MVLDIPPPSATNDLIRASEESRLLFNDGHKTFVTQAKGWKDDKRSVSDSRYLVVGYDSTYLSEKARHVKAASASLDANVRYEHIYSAVFEHGMLRYIDSAIMALTEAFGIEALMQGKLTPRDLGFPPVPRHVLRDIFAGKAKTSMKGALRDVAAIGRVINILAQAVH